MNKNEQNEMPSGTIDNVNSPRHYTSHPSGVECIEITEHYNFTIGNAIKYLWRQGLKSEEGMDETTKQIEDCKKAIWYINRHIMNLEKGVINGKERTKQDEKVASGGEEVKSRTGQKTHRTCVSASGTYAARNVPKLHSADDLNEGYDYGNRETTY